MRHEGTDEEEGGIIAHLLDDVNQEKCAGIRDGIKADRFGRHFGDASITPLTLANADMLGNDADRASASVQYKSVLLRFDPDVPVNPPCRRMPRMQAYLTGARWAMYRFYESPSEYS